MFLPHRTAATTEAKVSSSNSTSDASFATAVPLRPIAKPTSAARSAAASFVPSPVTATTSVAAARERATRAHHQRVLILGRGARQDAKRRPERVERRLIDIDRGGSRIERTEGPASPLGGFDRHSSFASSPSSSPSGANDPPAELGAFQARRRLVVGGAQHAAPPRDGDGGREAVARDDDRRDASPDAPSDRLGGLGAERIPREIAARSANEEGGECTFIEPDREQEESLSSGVGLVEARQGSGSGSGSGLGSYIRR